MMAYAEADLKSVTAQLVLAPLRLVRDRGAAASDAEMRQLLDDTLAACVEQFGQKIGEQLFWEATDCAIQALEMLIQLPKSSAKKSP